MRIETERLYLTELDESMAGDIYRNSQDANVKRFVPDEYFNSEEEVLEKIKYFKTRYDHIDGPVVYPMILKDGNVNIGYVSCFKCDEGYYKIGYHTTLKYTNKGYATEAIKALLPVLKEKLNLTEVYCNCLDSNKVSRRVALNCGFVLDFSGEGNYKGTMRRVKRFVYKF